MKILKPFNDEFPTLTQNNQTMNMEFAFVFDKGEESRIGTPWFLCRDYLCDIIFADNCGMDELPQIYGFQYDSSVHRFNRDKLSMAIRFPNSLSVERFKENLTYLNAIETEAGWNCTTYEETDKPRELYVEGDQRWLRSPLYISMITLYFRFMGHEMRGRHNIVGLGYEDRDFLERCKRVDPVKVLVYQYTILKDGSTLYENDEWENDEYDGLDMDDIHNGSGYMQFLGNYVAHWEEGFKLCQV
jgi:hypothetical protein